MTAATPAPDPLDPVEAPGQVGTSAPDPLDPVEAPGQVGTPAPNPWLGRRVISFAHQGGAWEGPSSTLWTMRRAVERGATALELDVHASIDGHLVVCHDERVDRTTNGKGRISELTLAELRQLDNAYWFVPGADVTPGLEEGAYPFRGRAPDDPDFRIATLAEVLEAFPGVVLNLDIKETAPDVPPYEETLANLLRDAGRADDVIVASFHDDATDAFHKIAPEIGTSAGTGTTTEIFRAVRSGQPLPGSALWHVAVQVPVMFRGTVVLDEEFVSAIHRQGLAVHVWTINDPAQMEHLVQLGVDGIISDRPTVLIEVLKRLGADWHR